MEASVKACVGYLRAFEQGMKVAAVKDDGQVSRDEARLLKKLNRATDRYIKHLERMAEK